MENSVIVLMAVAIIVVFAILQIILFFKLWRAANDIKKIKNSIVGDANPFRTSLLDEVAMELAVGHPDKALEILQYAKFLLIKNERPTDIEQQKNRLNLINNKISEIKTQYQK